MVLNVHDGDLSYLLINRGLRHEKELADNRDNVGKGGGVNEKKCSIVNCLWRQQTIVVEKR